MSCGSLQFYHSRSFHELELYRFLLYLKVRQHCGCFLLKETSNLRIASTFLFVKVPHHHTSRRITWLLPSRISINTSRTSKTIDPARAKIPSLQQPQIFSNLHPFLLHQFIFSPLRRNNSEDRWQTNETNYSCAHNPLLCCRAGLPVLSVTRADQGRGGGCQNRELTITVPEAWQGNYAFSSGSNQLKTLN